MALDGISRLVAVTQMKAENANSEGMVGAPKQGGTRTALYEALHAVGHNFKRVKAGGHGSQVDSIKTGFDNATKQLESQDKLGNFEIQDLMSTYNQAETLASSVLKKTDDTASAVIGKI